MAISIHALREEGDDRQHPSVYPRGNFYPRPPRGGRLNAFSSPWTPWEFLSTPSARRATIQNPVDGLAQHISIHALREEGDEHKLTERDLEERFLSTPSARRATAVRQCSRVSLRIFLSTPSARRATYAKVWNEWFRDISIHALREEGDRPVDANGREACYFYPRPPRGGRPGAEHMTGYTALFLSTPSARRATPVRR